MLVPPRSIARKVPVSVPFGTLVTAQLGNCVMGGGGTVGRNAGHIVAIFFET